LIELIGLPGARMARLPPDPPTAARGLDPENAAGRFSGKRTHPRRALQ